VGGPWAVSEKYKKSILTLPPLKNKNKNIFESIRKLC
jgi:hypothetical protein